MKTRKIVLEVIPQKKQRYDTAGDWFYDKNKNLVIRVSDTGVRDYNTLLQIHELVEVLLCEKAGITQDQVDAFDLHFVGDEPGDDPKAPYHQEHQAATFVEKLMSAYLGVDWQKYNKAVDSL